MTKALAPDDPKRVRKSRACVHCRNSKSRCEANPPPENENSDEIIVLVPPCSRCERLGERCEWVASKRKGRPRRLLKKIAPAIITQNLGSNVKVIDRSQQPAGSESGSSKNGAGTPDAFFASFSQAGFNIPSQVSDLYRSFSSPNLEEIMHEPSPVLAAYQGYIPVPSNSITPTDSLPQNQFSVQFSPDHSQPSSSEHHHQQHQMHNYSTEVPRQLFFDGNVLEPFDDPFNNHGDPTSAKNPLIELPELGFINYLLTDDILTSTGPAPIFDPKNALPLDSEIYTLINLFYSRAAHFINVLPPEQVFVSHNLPTCSPFLISAICAMAEAFWIGEPLKRDYFELTHDLFRGSCDFDTPLSRLIACVIMVHVSYGHAKAMVAIEYVKEAASIAIDNEVYRGAETLLSFENREGGFGEDVVKKAWWELFCLDIMDQFATGVHKSLLEATAGNITLGLPSDWLPQDNSQELLPPAMRLRVLSLLLFVTAPPSDVPTTREAQFQNLDLMISNSIVICESMYKSTVEKAKANSQEEWVNRFHREQAWMCLLMLSSARIRLHHAYMLPDFSLDFQYCSIEPRASQVEVVDDSLHLIPPALTANKSSLPSSTRTTPTTSPTERKPITALSSLSKLNFVPLASLKKIVGSGQGVFTLLRQESSSLIDLETVSDESHLRGGEGLVSLPLNQFSPPPPTRDRLSIPPHSPFFSCCQLNAGFAILVGIAAILLAKNQRAEMRKEEAAAMEWRVMALLSELDLADELLRREAKVWPVSWIKAERLKAGKKLVMESLNGKALSVQGFAF